MASNLPPAHLRQSATVLAEIAGKARVWARALPAIKQSSVLIPQSLVLSPKS